MSILRVVWTIIRILMLLAWYVLCLAFSLAVMALIFGLIIMTV